MAVCLRCILERVHLKTARRGDATLQHCGVDEADGYMYLENPRLVTVRMHRFSS